MDGLDRRARLARSRLYFVTDRIDEARLDAALRGGVDVVQLREKEVRDDDLVTIAESFARVCAAHGALFVLNDRPDLVERCAADGVHVGQGDAPLADARRAVGDDRVVGLSTHSRADMGNTQGADYLGVGTIFSTPTKPSNDAAGLELVRIARYAARLPWFAIGGIDESNVAAVAGSGAYGVAVVRAIRDADDPEGAARRLRSALPPSVPVSTVNADVLLPQIDWLFGENGKAAPHVHAEHLDVFHVLEGTLEARLGDGTARVPSGSTVAAPPLLVHGFRNPADEPLRYLNLHAPGGWRRGKAVGLPAPEYDTFGADRSAKDARPTVSAPGDGDRLSKPHRLAVVKVDRPELAMLEYFVDDEYDGASLHVHLRHADCFYILDGRLSFEFDEPPTLQLPRGYAIVIPPGCLHSFRSAAKGTRFLNVHAPSCGFVDYMRKMDAGDEVDDAQYDSYEVTRPSE